MISRQLFINKIGEAILLTNSNIKKSAQDLIYDRIKDNYTNGDFEKAIEEVSESDTLKLSYPVIVKRLNYHRMIRREQEADSDKRREQEDIKRFWAMGEGAPDGTCVNRKCYSCERKRCDTMGRATIAAIKKMLNGEITKEDMMRGLARDFHGAGFEKERVAGTQREFVSRDEIRTGKLRVIVKGKEWWKLPQQSDKNGSPLPIDDDFIPELEVDDVVQDTLGLDQQAGRDAR